MIGWGNDDAGKKLHRHFFFIKMEAVLSALTGISKLEKIRKPVEWIWLISLSS
jgi:hypothetical protein